jgi:hypothetical protein
VPLTGGISHGTPNWGVPVLTPFTSANRVLFVPSNCRAPFPITASLASQYLNSETFPESVCLENRITAADIDDTFKPQPAPASSVRCSSAVR